MPNMRILTPGECDFVAGSAKDDGFCSAAARAGFDAAGGALGYDIGRALGSSAGAYELGAAIGFAIGTPFGPGGEAAGALAGALAASKAGGYAGSTAGAAMGGLIADSVWTWICGGPGTSSSSWFSWGDSGGWGTSWAGSDFSSSGGPLPDHDDIKLC